MPSCRGKGQLAAKQKREAKQKLKTAVTVADFGERHFKEVMQRDRMNPINMRRQLDNEVYPAFGHKRLEDVSILEVQGFVYRKRDNAFEAAAADLRNLIKRMYDYAVETGACTVNPAKAVGMRFITRARSRTRALSPDEIKIYLRTI